MRDKKGVLGLPTVMAVFILILIIAVLAITIIITMASLRDVAETIDIVTGTTVNESITSSGLGTALDPSTQKRRNLECTIVLVINTTSEDIVTSLNYTEDLCIITNASHEFAAGEGWDVTYDWSYSSASVSNIETNLSGGVSEFFDNTSTIYSILIVVVIILAIAIIIAVVTTFGGGAASGRRKELGSSGGGSSGTLMGV